MHDVTISLRLRSNSKAISQALVVIIVLLIIASAFGGYEVGTFNQKTAHVTTVTATFYSLKTSTITETNSCNTLSSEANTTFYYPPLGFESTVAYQGNWSVSIATFASQTFNASALAYVCTYNGSGTETFSVGLTNYLGGWSTIVVLAHKLNPNGTLSVQASIGNQTDANYTTQTDDTVLATLSYYFANG